MKLLGPVLLVGFVAGPLGVTGLSNVLVGLVLAAGVAAVAGGLAFALGLAPLPERARRSRR